MLCTCPILLTEIRKRFLLLLRKLIEGPVAADDGEVAADGAPDAHLADAFLQVVTQGVGDLAGASTDPAKAEQDLEHAGEAGLLDDLLAAVVDEAAKGEAAVSAEASAVVTHVAVRQQRLHHEETAPAQHLAEEGHAMNDTAFLEAGGDHDIGIATLDDLHHVEDVGGIVRVVGVHDDDSITDKPAFAEAGLDAFTKTFVHHMLHELERHLFGKFAADVGRAVLRAIIDDDDRVTEGHLADGVADVFKQCRQILLLVVGGKNDGDFVDLGGRLDGLFHGVVVD